MRRTDHSHFASHIASVLFAACLGGFVDAAFVRPCLQNIICTSFPLREGNSILQKILFIFLVKEMGTRKRIIMTLKKNVIELRHFLNLCHLQIGRSNAGLCKAWEELLYGRRFHTAKYERQRNKNQSVSSLGPGSCGSHLFDWWPGGIFCKRYTKLALQNHSWDGCFLTGYPLRKVC